MRAEVLRCGFVGLGRIAWQFDRGRPIHEPAQTHWGACVRNSRCKPTIAFSPVAQEREDFRRATNVPAVASLEELLRIQPDIVSICSPTELHAEHVVACLEAGIPMIWLEKPPATSLGELDKLIEAERVCGASILVNYMRRYSRLYASLKRLFTSGDLGEPLDITVNYSRGLELNGSHFLDLVLWLWDDPASFSVQAESDAKLEPCPSFTLKSPGRPPARFIGHQTDYHINDVVVTFSRGRASILSGGLESRLECRTENERFPGFFRLKEAPLNFLDPPGSDSCFDDALADLIAAREEGRATCSSLATARGAQQVIEAVRRAFG